MTIPRRAHYGEGPFRGLRGAPEDNMLPHVSRRAKAVTPFLAMEVMERARALEAQGRDVIYLCVGEPDFPTPAPVADAAVAAIRFGAGAEGFLRFSYANSLGNIDRAMDRLGEYFRSQGWL